MKIRLTAIDTIRFEEGQPENLPLGDFDGLVISSLRILSPQGQVIIAHEEGLGWRRPEDVRSEWNDQEFGNFIWSELRFEIVA